MASEPDHEARGHLAPGYRAGENERSRPEAVGGTYRGSGLQDLSFDAGSDMPEVRLPASVHRAHSSTDNTSDRADRAGMRPTGRQRLALARGSDLAAARFLCFMDSLGTVRGLGFPSGLLGPSEGRGRSEVPIVAKPSPAKPGRFVRRKGPGADRRALPRPRRATPCAPASSGSRGDAPAAWSRNPGRRVARDEPQTESA